MGDEVSEKAEYIPKHIQDFIFVRELSEVYLLIDHLSGRWDRTLTDGSKDDPNNPLSGSKWVEQVCEIGWPPKGNDVQQAAQAAILLKAKDKLNTAAKPASGMTIAFTLLVSGEDNVDKGGHDPSVWRRLRRALRRIWRRNSKQEKTSANESAANGKDPPTPEPPLDRGRNGNPPSRLSLARLAYPGLVSRARTFNWAIRVIIGLLLVWLMATCALSWDIAAGHAIFVRVDALRAEESQYDASIKAIANDASKHANASASQAEPSQDIGKALISDCKWQRLIEHPSKGDLPDPFTDVDTIQLCNKLARHSLEYAVSRVDLAYWLADWRSGMDWISRKLCAHHCDPWNSDFPRAATDEQWGAILLQVLATSVLPLCYGFLGAGAAVVRDLWAKMKESMLSPRDLTLALGQLALGAVIGACIGLFVSPTGTPSQGASGLLGSVVLSASALSFVAGFGVEGVFVALESLIKRVFNIPAPAAKK